MKIVLATPPQPEKGSYRAFYPQLGLLYLASYAEKNCRIRDLTVDYVEGSLFHIDGFLDRISRMNPDVIGLNIVSTNSSIAYKTINSLKEKLPNSLIVCGGPHPTACPIDVLQRSKTDVCIVGEGEITFQQLLEAYERNTSYSNIAGIAIRRNGQVVQTPIRPLIADLDSIPFPAWEKINIRNYQGYFLQKAWPDVHIMTSRGCPFNCTFCANAVWKLTKPWIRLRSPENVAKEVEYLVNKGVREIYDFSAEFNASEKWAIKVADKISDIQPGIPFKTLLRADKISERLASSLSKMGCWLASVGIESGNQEVLNGINKGISINQVIRGLNLLKKYDIKVHGFFMIFNVWEENGILRVETPEMCRKTLKFARQLVSAGLLDHLSWATNSPLPGAKLFDIAMKYNLLDKSIAFSDFDFEDMPMTLPGISPRDITRVKFEGMCLQVYSSFLHKGVNMKNRELLTRKVRTFIDYGLSYFLSR